MPVKKFAYSLFRVYVAFLLYFGGVSFAIIIQMVQGLFTFDLLSVSIVVVPSAFFTRFIIRVFIPTINQKFALTIDEEKLYYRVDNKTVYWSDVGYIVKRWAPQNKSTYIAFELLNNKEVHIDPSFLIADDDEVYIAIQEYFKESLIADGQLGYIANNDEV